MTLPHFLIMYVGFAILDYGRRELVRLLRWLWHRLTTPRQVNGGDVVLIPGKRDPNVPGSRDGRIIFEDAYGNVTHVFEPPTTSTSKEDDQ